MHPLPFEPARSYLALAGAPARSSADTPPSARSGHWRGQCQTRPAWRASGSRAPTTSPPQTNWPPSMSQSPCGQTRTSRPARPQRHPFWSAFPAVYIHIRLQSAHNAGRSSWPRHVAIVRTLTDCNRGTSVGSRIAWLGATYFSTGIVSGLKPDVDVDGWKS